jgi:hypothetical protein
MQLTKQVVTHFGAARTSMLIWWLAHFETMAQLRRNLPVIEWCQMDSRVGPMIGLLT